MNAVKATIQYSTIAESHKCIKIVHCVVYPQDGTAPANEQ